MRKIDEIVIELAEQQMQTGTHVHNIEDFISVEDFYLEAIKKDSYAETIEELTTEEEQHQYGISQIWEAVKNYISENASLNDDILTAKQNNNSLEDYIIRYFNCVCADIDNVGDVYIINCNPKFERWIDYSEKSTFIKWFNSI